MVAIMATDGGPHPPEKWAEQTASSIVDVIQIEGTAPAGASIEKQKLKLAIMEAMLGHHSLVQEGERGALKKHGHARLAAGLDPTERADHAVSDIIAATKDTMFAEHFAKPEVQAFVRATLAQHFATSMHIERSWHADRHPDTPHAKAFRAKHQGGA